MSAAATVRAAAVVRASTAHRASPAARRAPSASPRRQRTKVGGAVDHGSLHRRGHTAVLAVADPGEAASSPAVSAADPLQAFFDEQMPDEAAMLARSTFPVAPEELIAKTKGILATNNGADDPSRLASSFQFVAPVVGPLTKEKFLEAFSSFKIEEAFPDAKFNYYAFRVDPFEPNRVWYDARFVGTHTGQLAGTIPATGKKVEAPPQACSMLFNEAGECTQLTVGYVMDKQIGNTGGLGGVFGILYAIGYGLPFPEAQPWQKSIQYSLFNQVGALSTELQKFIKSISGGD